MKKTLTALLALAVLVTLAMPALAAKGGKPGQPDNPPLGGTTCAEDGWASDIDDLSLMGRSAEACVDVSDVNPGAWDVTVNVEEGTLKSLLVVLRDSVSPGDACGEPIYLRNISAPSTFKLEGALEGAAGDYVNACGVEWAEWVDGVYYDTVEPKLDSPLALLVFSRGSADLELTLDVDLP